MASVEAADELDIAQSALSACTAVVFDFLQSKGLFAAERALRTELEVNSRKTHVHVRNLWQSQIERLLNVRLTRPDPALDNISAECMRRRQLDMSPMSSGATPTSWHYAALDHASEADASSCSTPSRRLGVRLHDLNPTANAQEGIALRRQRSRSAQQTCVVFREGLPLSDAAATAVEMLPLPLLYNPHIRGLEDSPELALHENTVIAGRYRVTALIGKGSFSRVVQCYDRRASRSVSVKVLHNDKDCVDQGIGEVRLLTLLAQRDPLGEVRVCTAHHKKLHQAPRLGSRSDSMQLILT